MSKPRKKKKSPKRSRAWPSIAPWSSYTTTWLGENQSESDMAFYSTFPFDNLVGPGIGRGEYGGFLMSLPARRMYDVWQDPDYEFAESKSERLGRTIMYISIGQLSPISLKKIRAVHVLDGYDKREIAKDHIRSGPPSCWRRAGNPLPERACGYMGSVPRDGRVSVLWPGSFYAARPGKIYCSERRVRDRRPGQSPRWRLLTHLNYLGMYDDPASALLIWSVTRQ